MLTVRDLQYQSYSNSKAHGFHNDDRVLSFLSQRGFYVQDPMIQKIAKAIQPEWSLMRHSLKMLLAVGEIVEAHEELRSGHSMTETYYREDGKPEGVPSELADAMIRLGDLAEMAGIPLTEAIEEKAKFNEGRPYMHGRTC